MRLLLDTHALIWWMSGEAGLSRAAEAAIRDGDVHVFVSAVSAYEIALKHGMGRLPKAGLLAERFEAEVDLETMGIFSLIGLAYAFQFLWSPLIDKVDIPLLRRLGKRKQWIVPMQLLLGAILVTMSLLEPRTQLGMFSLLAGIGAFASATQDIAINEWRIDVADEVATIDILSTVYQMGFRLSSLVGGALGLIIAARIGWPETYMMMGGILLAVGAVGLFAPNAEGAAELTENDEQVRALRMAGELAPEIRNRALAAVGALWAAAIGAVLAFMIMSMTYAPEDRPNPTQFIVVWGPWIIVATIILPSLIAGWLSGQKKTGRHLLTHDAPPVSGGSYVLDHLYRALVLPLVELVGRMGWSLVLIFAVVLTYRICDAIWGSLPIPSIWASSNTRMTTWRLRRSSSASGRSSRGSRWAGCCLPRLAAWPRC